ncbi:MAG: NYN domain-containing protein [Woeseiaceae bacterium]
MGSLAPFKSRLGGFFLPENRVVFLVDGFNVYHSAKVAAADLGGASTLWLDLRSLLSSYISLFGRDAVLSDIYYFSALARHMKLFDFDSCGTVVLVTGDTDLAPAVRMAAEVFPEKNICFAFPYKRKNKELNAITHKSFLIRKERYATHQFSDPFKGVAGRTINKPATW